MMECHPTDGGRYDLYVEIEYDDETKIRQVKATCTFDPGANACKSLFATFAHTLLVEQPDLQEQGEQWAGDNADTDNVTTIGGIRFDISLSPHRIRATTVP